MPEVDSLDSRRLLGVVTDPDLAVRGLAEGKGADASVDGVMTKSPYTARPETDLREIQEAMAERQLRRVPIVDADGCCVGIIAQADLARSAGERVSERDVAVVVERISEPAPESGGSRGSGGSSRIALAKLIR